MTTVTREHLAGLDLALRHIADINGKEINQRGLLAEIGQLIAQASAAPEQEAVAWAICHIPGQVDELSATYANKRAAQAHVDGYRGDGSPELHITDLYTHPSAEIERLRAENKRLDLMVSQADYNYDCDRDHFRQQMADAQALLREFYPGCGLTRCETVELRKRAHAFLSATAQPAEVKS